MLAVVEQDVDGEPLCLVMISSLIAAGQTLNVKPQQSEHKLLV